MMSRMLGLDIGGVSDLQLRCKAAFRVRLFAIMLMGYEAELHNQPGCARRREGTRPGTRHPACWINRSKINRPQRLQFTAPDICSRSACRESCWSVSRGACCQSPAARRCAFATSANAFSGSVSSICASEQIRPHSRDDLDRCADRNAEIAVRAPLIDGDFGKSVRILVPEGHARWAIAEGPCALQHVIRRCEPCVGR